MSIPTLTRRSLWNLVFAAAIWGTACIPACAGSRRIQVGDVMPEFTLNAVNGEPFHYVHHDNSEVLGVVILQKGYSRLPRIVADIENIVQALRPSGEGFACVAIVSGPGGEESVPARGEENGRLLPLLLDPGFKVWGKLGVVATPTTLVVGTDHKVQWIKAGYSYDFIPGLRAQLEKALGLGDASGSSVPVETLANTSDRAREERHLQLARMLAARGRLKEAVGELQEAYRRDPNSVSLALELGEFLCRAGSNEAALDLVSKIKVVTNSDKSRAMLVAGCARRQMGQSDAAAELLEKALALDPRSSARRRCPGHTHQPS